MKNLINDWFNDIRVVIINSREDNDINIMDTNR